MLLRVAADVVDRLDEALRREDEARVWAVGPDRVRRCKEVVDRITGFFHEREPDIVRAIAVRAGAACGSRISLIARGGIGGATCADAVWAVWNSRGAAEKCSCAAAGFGNSGLGWGV